MLVQVAISLNLQEPLTYSLPDPLADRLGVGCRVIVPVGHRLETGWITALGSQYKGRTRPVAGWINDPFQASTLFLKFALHASQRFLLAPGILLDGALSPRRRNRRQIRALAEGKPGRPLHAMGLSDLKALGQPLPLEFMISSRSLGDMGGHPNKAMEGTGFSERLILDYQREKQYREIVDACRQAGTSVLILTPDNRIADSLAQSLSGVAAYHTSEPLARREALWSQAVSGSPVAIAGGKSALLLPFARLGTVVIDQPTGWCIRTGERESDVGPELARLRAAVYRTPLVQGGHTYPLSVYRRRSFVSILDNRMQKKTSTEVLPLLPGTRGIPPALMQRISMHVNNRDRLMIMVNRLRGEEFYFCPHCRQAARCMNCREILRPMSDAACPGSCPACGTSWYPEKGCSKCGGEWARIPRVNLESLRAEVAQRILGMPPPLINADMKPEALAAVAAPDGGAVVMGTRAVLRPVFRHAFKTIIYFRPESDFHFTEYDAAEQIQSVVGRMRDLLAPGGRVEIFSAFHFHYGLKLLDSQEAFLERESKYRRWFHLPPFADEYQLVFRDANVRKLAARMRKARRMIQENLSIRETRLETRKPQRGKVYGRMVVCGGISALKLTGIVGTGDVRVTRTS